MDIAPSPVVQSFELIDYLYDDVIILQLCEVSRYENGITRLRVLSPSCEISQCDLSLGSKPISLLPFGSHKSNPSRLE